MGWAEEMGYDAYDEGDFRDPEGKRCNRCGEIGLSFDKINGKWKLVDLDGNLHRCDPVKLAKLDFAPV